MSNPRKRRRSRSKSSHRRRRNPVANPHRRKRHHFGFRRRKSHRNPSFRGISLDLKTSAKIAVGATLGNIGAGSLPQILLPAMNAGWTGYLLNLASAVGLGMLAQKFAGKDVALGVYAGGLSYVGYRFYAEHIAGSKISVKGLGDPDFQGLGEYLKQNFAVPPVSHRQANGYLLDENPGGGGYGAASSPAIAAPAAAMGVDRYAGRY